MKGACVRGPCLSEGSFYQGSFDGDVLHAYILGPKYR